MASAPSLASRSAELISERGALLASLFDARVSLACGDPRAEQGPRSPAEEAQLSGASEPRRNEFRNGRACAEAALARFGVTAPCIPQGQNGEPIWPARFVGGITHGDDFCAAVVALASEFASLGVDVETDLPVSRAFARRVCSPLELARCAELERSVEPLALARVVFSVKETVHKLQHPLSAKVINWRDIEVLLADGHFTAFFLTDCPPFCSGYELHGRWLRGAGLIMSGCSLGAPVIKTM